MPVISLASSKGGSGKSTTALILASAYVEDGYRVHIIDADRSARLYRWGQQGRIPASLTVESVTDKTLVAAINAANVRCDMVIVDVEGSANVSVGLAIGYSNAVIVPANLSAPDVEDAVATVGLVRETEQMIGRAIPHALLWSRMSAIRSREIAALKDQVKEGGVPVLGGVMERTAYKSMFSFGQILSDLSGDDVPGLEKARNEARDLGVKAAGLIRQGIVQEAAA